MIEKIIPIKILIEKLKKVLCKIRDFFWPMIDKDGETASLNVRLGADQCEFCDEEQLNQAIQMAILYAKQEDERRTNVESKASLLIGAFSVAVTILLAMLKDYIDYIQKEKRGLAVGIAVFIGIILIYLCRAALYSIKVLERGTYSNVGIPNFLFNGDKEYKVKLFVEIRNSIYQNFDAINRKVENMVIAQETFKCAVRTVVFFATTLLFFISVM